MKHSCYFIICFGCLIGFIIHFYIIFGTNLLTGGPAQICCFFCLFQCFEEKEYQTESKRNEINWRSYFWKESYRMDLDPTSGAKGGAHEGGGAPPRAPPPPKHAPCLVGPPKLHRRTPCTHIYLCIVKLPERRLDREFRRQKPP